MKIFAHTHTYGLNATSGADKFMQSLLEYLALRGCIVTAAIDNCPLEYELNGVEIISNRYMIAEHYEQADAIFTHLIGNNEALVIAARFDKPVFQLAHNKENTTRSPYIIFNSV